MTPNLKGKYQYVVRLFDNYFNWYEILRGRILNRSISKIQLRNGIKILGGPKSEIVGISDEIFIQKIYNPYFLEIKKADTVVDIGANIGVFSLFAAYQGAEKIIAVEPLPKNVVLIKKNFKENNLKPPTIIQAAVSGTKRQAKLYLGDSDSHNLLFDHNYRNEKYKKHIMVPTITLAGIVGNNRIAKVDFLKVDCEGSEGEIIETTPLSVWKKIKKIAIEYHDGVSSLTSAEIAAKLRKIGYKVVIKRIDSNFGYIYAF